MRKLALPVCLLLLVSVGAAKKKPKNKAMVDPRLLSAQFVEVVSATGGETQVQTQYEDRQAIFAVRNALEKWGHYRIVYSNPDLIVEVRKGRLAGPYMGGGTGPTGEPPIPGAPGGQPGGVNIGVGTEVSNVSDDMITIYDGHMGTDGPALWRKTMANGLIGKAPLVEELKKDVEKGLAAQQAQQKNP